MGFQRSASGKGWGSARPSEDAAELRRSSGVLSSSNRLSVTPKGPPLKPLPDARSPKEAAALLRRVLKTCRVQVDGSECVVSSFFLSYSGLSRYDCCFAATDLVLALMQHRKWTRQEAVETGRLLLSGGFVARVGDVTQVLFFWVACALSC